MTAKRRTPPSLKFSKEAALTPEQEIILLLEKPITMTTDQEIANEIKADLIRVFPHYTGKETTMSQAATVVQTETQTVKEASVAKEESSMLAKAGNFLSENKWKIASAVGVAVATAAAFAYREEIADFIGSKVSGSDAGGDAFM